MTSNSSGRLNACLNLLCRLLDLIHRGVVIVLQANGRVLTQILGYVPWSIKLAFLSAVMAYFAINLGILGQDILLQAGEFSKKHIDIFETEGLLASFRGLAILACLIGAMLILSLPFTLIRRRLTLLFLRVTGAGFFVVWVFLLWFIVKAPALLHNIDHKGFDKYMRNDLWLTGFGYWLAVAVVPALFLLAVVLRSVQELYTGQIPESEPVGDRIVSSIQTGGRDPRFRSSTYWATFLHVSILVGPIILRGCGVMAPYGVPKGSGNPVLQIIKVKLKKPKKKKKKFVLAMNSPIIFHHPDIDESKVLEEMDRETEDQYQAMSLKGKLGKGGGKGGWPHGMENARVRFIRLKYGGGDWDQDMGVGSDYNFLIQFHKMTGFRIADNTEAIEIRKLNRFPKHRGPPFVFITGKGDINVTSRDVKILRWYCLEEGGLIFADNGGGHFDHSFRRLMKRVFPDKQWIDIANDDILFRQPFFFPNGAPPLWHHSGYRAMGMKHEGRWVVFYHQGDLNDAWKTGHSGVSKGLATMAYRLGVNIVNYAFNQYMSIHYGD